ncbi:ATP-grasp domain-containing protein [Geitlerinema sp. CS-897]|nr:ATP-grasp domain-containing protein [Geitlerinema sp. CS-897]
MFYIQMENGLPHHFDAACALYGCRELEEPYQLISYEELVTGQYDDALRRGIFVGTVEFMQEVWNRLKIPMPRLPRNSNRVSQCMTLGEALERRERENKPLFIKPKDMKVFTGFVHEGYSYRCLEDVPLDVWVLVYPVFSSPIVSEWRAYIHRHEILDVRNYSGDVFVFPDKDYLDRVVRENKSDFPSTYCIDIGVLESQEQVVIEFNDMWAIGNYGIPNWLYVKALRDRYREIIRG